MVKKKMKKCNRRYRLYRKAGDYEDVPLGEFTNLKQAIKFAKIRDAEWVEKCNKVVWTSLRDKIKKPFERGMMFG